MIFQSQLNGNSENSMVPNSKPPSSFYEPPLLLIWKTPTKTICAGKWDPEWPLPGWWKKIPHSIHWIIMWKNMFTSIFLFFSLHPIVFLHFPTFHIYPICSLYFPLQPYSPTSSSGRDGCCALTGLETPWGKRWGFRQKSQ